MNAWKCLLVCAGLVAFVSAGCAGEEPDKRIPQAGAGGRSGNGGTSGTTGGSAGTQDTGGTTGGSSGDGGDSGAGSGSGGMAGDGSGGMDMRVFDAGNEPDRNDVMAEELCDRLSTIQCAGEAYCCDNPGRDFAACKEEMQDGCEDQLMFDAIASAPQAAFSAEHASMAYEEIERLASECDPTVAAFGESIAGLRGMFAGTLAVSSSCLPLNPTFREEVAKSLASCSDPEHNACLPMSVINWVCTPRAGVGGHCFTDVNCTPGLFCDNPDFNLAGSDCAERKEIGTPCGLPNECKSLFCKGGQCVEATAQTAYCLASD